MAIRRSRTSWYVDLLPHGTQFLYALMFFSMAWWWPTLEVDTRCQTINIRKIVRCVWLKTSICVCNRQPASVFRFHAQWKRGHLHYVIWSTSKLQRMKVLTFSIQKLYINCTFAHSLHVDITSNFHIASFEPRMQLQHNILFVCCCWCSIAVCLVITTTAQYTVCVLLLMFYRSVSCYHNPSHKWTYLWEWHWHAPVQYRHQAQPQPSPERRPGRSW